MASDFLKFPDDVRVVPWNEIIEACAEHKLQILVASDDVCENQFHYQLEGESPVGPFEYPDACYAHAYFHAISPRNQEAK